MLHVQLKIQLVPHPARSLIEPDAADILDLRGFIVHTVVQMAAHKQDTKVHFKTLFDTILQPRNITNDRRLFELIFDDW